MNIYLYDSFVNQKKYNNTLAQIETRLTDFGLNGKIVRLSLMTSIYETIENEIKNGAKTITAVGNNQILNQVINALARLSSTDTVNNENILLGFIPVGKSNNTIAPYLGISLAEQACDVLSARRIKQLDLGQANNHYFLTQALITSQGTTVKIDQNYSIEIMGQGEIGVANLHMSANLPSNIKTSPQDGLLELYIKTNGTKKFLKHSSRQSKHSIFSFTNLTILNNKHKVIIDNTLQIPAPVNIMIAKEKINLIVGKTRNF